MRHDQGEASVTRVSMFDGWWSIPNAFTLARLLLLPLFLHVLFALDNRAAAAWLLGAIAAAELASWHAQLA